MKHLLIIFLFLLTGSALFGQSNITNLVFEGAGIKGLAYSGVVYELEQQGVMDGVRQVAGTSAGAITAMLVALDYRAEEVLGIVSATKFQSFNDVGFFFFGGVNRMARSYGWYKGEKFLRWLEGHIAHKTGNADITFAEMKAAGFRDLYVVASCINQQRQVVLSHQTYPNMKIKDAVRISMSIPFYFEPIWIDQDGQRVKRPKDLNGFDLMVDGGILGNYPIFVFDTILVNDCGQPQRWANPATLGVRMDSDAQIALDRSSGGLAPQDLGSFSQYAAASFIFIAESLNRPFCTPGDWARTISVSSLDIGPKIKRMSEDQKSRLFESGRAATAAFLGEKG